MAQPFYRISKITNKRYDLFSIVKIINLKQIEAYIKNGATVLDIEIGENYKTGNPMVVFYFDRAETQDLYDKWCKHEL